MTPRSVVPRESDRVIAAVREINAFNQQADTLLQYMQRFPAFRDAADRVARAVVAQTVLMADSKLATGGVRVVLPSNVSYLRVALSGAPVVLSQVERDTVRRLYRALVRFAAADLHDGTPPLTIQELMNARDTGNLPQLHAWYCQLIVDPGATKNVTSSHHLANRRLDTLRSSPMQDLMRSWARNAHLPIDERVTEAVCIVESVATELEKQCNPLSAFSTR